MSAVVDNPSPIDPEEEEGLAVSAHVGAIWTGSRLVIGACTFLYGAYAFTFFYLRSLNSHGMWHPAHQQPSVLIGTAAIVLVIASALVHNLGLHRLRSGLNLDWRVAAITCLALGLAAVGLEVWLLTRLDFFPGASGYASVFVDWVPVYVVTLLGGLYWLETVVARSLRVRQAWIGEGGLGGSVTPEAIRMRASLDAFNYFWSYLALVGVAFWVLFYLVG
jgi:heme/copper-type cytochrome/quinol oxidase subunit 3